MAIITILDYGAGNLKSVTNILEVLNCEYTVTDKKEDIINAEKLILPGQGHFGQFMEALNKKDLSTCLVEKIKSGIPFLGICLGIQVLFEESEEAPGIKGLGIFKGKCVRFTQGKVPQIGWNKLQTTANNSVLTEDYVYFVNSYHVVPEDKSIVSAYASYNVDFVASLEHKNIFAFQFHPEKSGKVGYGFLKNFMQL
ncbi:MAG: imidazole glycerol phosphate synthase, glutamine amidotransferase subunit [Candidatus Melainabacteria bacterium GWF2_37_15]|nr:MAG: imidazole glycerol phosphate synthase, glutamine amidotransferase subunit [Candidatus Melainabacteria bacterium GWF2_37_15]